MKNNKQISLSPTPLAGSKKKDKKDRLIAKPISSSSNDGKELGKKFPIKSTIKSSRKSKEAKQDERGNQGEQTRPIDPISELPIKFPIVGVGSSAGGLEAIKELTSQITSNLGLAFVIIQHLNPEWESLTPEILGRTTKIPVKVISDGMQVQPNFVYVMPEVGDLGIKHGIFKILPRIKTRGQHLPVDFFFSELAEELKAHAIGVVLSGTASDGTEGLRAIKANGGITFAQDPKSAQYDGMPKSAILSGAVDFILAPKEIVAELARISKHSYLLPEEPDSDLETPQLFEQKYEGLAAIFAILGNVTHVDFSHYKHNTI